jgi:uncharacterized protein (DUF488 family)
MARPLFTIGYEQATPAAVLAELAGARVDLLVDVRAVTASRRAGISKRQWAAALDQRGISYLHLRELGTPAEGRTATRSRRFEELRRIFSAHMRTLPAREALDELTTLVRSGSAFACFAMSAITRIVIDLNWRKWCASRSPSRPKIWSRGSTESPTGASV